jgi:hypothetical protein
MAPSGLRRGGAAATLYAMSRIIVSYRRSDSTAVSGRVYDRLTDRYGEASVFMDIDKIPFGTDFRQHIRDVLRNADILLAVVGPRWTGAGADGRARITDEADPVRVEIDAALAQRIAIIPLLVDGAQMPAAADLPESIRDFAYINAAPVDSGRDFRAHMERLIRSMDEILAAKPGAKPPTGQGPHDREATPKRRRTKVAAISIPIALLILGAIGFAVLPDRWFAAAPDKPAERFPGNEVIVAMPKKTDARDGPGNLDARPAPAAPATPTQAAPPRPAQPTYRVLANVSGGVQNLRSGPAVRYPLVVAIPAGATGIVLGECRKAEDNTRPWCAAAWRNYSGFISSCCIVDEKTGAPPRVP